MKREGTSVPGSGEGGAHDSVDVSPDHCGGVDVLSVVPHRTLLSPRVHVVEGETVPLALHYDEVRVRLEQCMYALHPCLHHYRNTIMGNH